MKIINFILITDHRSLITFMPHFVPKTLISFALSTNIHIFGYEKLVFLEMEKLWLLLDPLEL